MGTRHLIIVKLNRKIKVAQYGQWDGYLSGQGKTIANFLAKSDLNLFKEKLKDVSFISEKEVKSRFAEFEKDGGLNLEQAEKFKAKYPELSRDTSAKILDLIYAGKAKELHDSRGFKKDQLFCEFCYEIDLDKETIKVSGGIDLFLPLSEFTADKILELEGENGN